jgi:hypothetical protein
MDPKLGYELVCMLEFRHPDYQVDEQAHERVSVKIRVGT